LIYNVDLRRPRRQAQTAFRAQRTISIGFFSRRREISPESSFSVLG
jgi:hypothetical protein